MNKKLINICANASKEAYSKSTIVGKHTDTEVLITHFDEFIVVAFRGTDSWRDVKQDLSRVQSYSKVGDIHSGFRECYKEVYTQILSKVVASRLPLVFTGHSLGGAIAQIASALLPVRNTCITFGSPRVGDLEFCKNLERNTEGNLLLVEHKLDRVPWVPFFGYTKPKKAIRKVWNWSLLATSAHSIDNYVKLVAKTDLS